MPGIGDRIRSAGSQLSTLAPSALPGWLTTAGIASWLLVGIAAVFALAAWFLSASASISIPLLLALVIGMIAYPLCERMTERGLSKSAAAALVLVLLTVVLVGVSWITVSGIVSQWPAIQEQIQRGTAEMAAELSAAGFDLEAVRAELSSAGLAGSDEVSSNPLAASLLSSLGAAFTTGLSGTISLLFGVFISATLLYYVLSDFPTVAGWIARHMGGLPVEIGEGIVEDAVSAMRGYFRATTISGFVVAVIIGISMVILGVPLALTVALVTFATCYIPFFGAIISGAFAFIVALGTNGLPTAIILLVIVLVTQNVLQTVINARVMGESLNLHPLVVLVVTMLGGIFGGLLGAALGAPLAALLVNAGRRLSAAFHPAGDAEPLDPEAV